MGFLLLGSFEGGQWFSGSWAISKHLVHHLLRILQLGIDLVSGKP